MPDKKLTDAEIVKAYELCFAEKGTSYTCAVCPYHQFGELCKVNRDKDALDLINRQKAEIERLQKYNTEVAYKHYSDGVNDFAEMLKSEMFGKYCTHFNFEITNAIIDNISKKMKGGKK